MMRIRDLLNKVKWSENHDDYEISYLDRVLQQEVRVKFKSISRVEDEFFIIGESSIPLHRVIKVYKKGKLVWERKVRPFKVDKKVEKKIKKKLMGSLGWTVGVQNPS
ncbi:DUF504 domain-containing protein [Candidatus Woesearchaeota archaeon]|nr:DUF504 domain-containing protein [Candidatus Woesearchaeota archaeon]